MRLVGVLLLLTACPFRGARVDDPTEDAATEGLVANEAGSDAVTGCPGNFAALPNSGTRGHRYLLLAMNRPFVEQRDTCAATGTFVAFPDGADSLQELAALRALAGEMAWIGVNDIATEGDYRNSLDQPISIQTQALMLGGNTIVDDCTLIKGNNVGPESCNLQQRAVCECVP